MQQEERSSELESERLQQQSSERKSAESSASESSASESSERLSELESVTHLPKTVENKSVGANLKTAALNLGKEAKEKESLYETEKKFSKLP